MVALSAEKRSDPAQQLPPDDLDGFPRLGVQGDDVSWYRQHAAQPTSPDGGCWYFNGYAAGDDVEGRFDLELTNGPCYLAQTEDAAVGERVGRQLASGMPVTPYLYEGRVVTQVPVPAEAPDVADATHAVAAKKYKVTRELGAGNDYALTAAWATAVHAARFTGIAYDPRFSLGESGAAYAVFGDAGPQSGRPVINARPLLEVLVSSSFPVVLPSIPQLSQVHPDDEAEPEEAPGPA